MVASNLNYQARRTPTFLTGLVERRARADGQVQRLAAMLTDIRLELAKALTHRDACEALLKSYYAGVDASELRPINGWMGRYGQRGAVVAAIRQLLAAAGTAGVTTSEVGSHLAGMFGLEFATPRDRKKWMQNSVAVRLRELKAAGEVEPLHNAAAELGKVGRWRLKAASPATGVSLAATAAAHGIRVEFTDEDEVS
jgi:hypothetical protein